MSGSRTELYVYYRVAQADGRAALQTVLAFQSSLRREHLGLATRVLQRSAQHGDAVTLMEIYSFDDARRAGVDRALQARIEDAAAALSGLLLTPRQAETFDALD